MGIAIRGVANLIIADKRSDGHVEKQAWGMDFPMSTAANVRAIGGAYQNASRQIAEWLCSDTIPIAELGAVILEPNWSSDAMSLAAWTQQSSSYWKEVRPPGWQMDWLKYHDGRPDQEGALVHKSRLSKNPSVGFTFLRAQPPQGQTSSVYLALILNALGTVQYQLELQQDGAAYPSLYKSTNVGSSWTKVDQLATDEALRWATGAFGRVDWLRWLWIPDHFIIHLGDGHAPWIYYEPGLEVPEGHLGIYIGGGQAAFHVAQLTYPTSGTIERNVGIEGPSFLNDEESDTTEHLGQEPDGTAIATEMLTDSGMVYPKATLTSDGNRTPALYEIQATRPAKHSTPVTTVLFDNVAEEDDQGKLVSAEWYCAQGGRGSWFKARLVTDGAGSYDYDGNEKAALKVAADIGGALTYYTQVTGYLDSPKRQKSGAVPATIVLDLKVSDRFIRLKNKDAYMTPSFAGWTFEKAWKWLFHECAGIPESHLTLDAGAGDFTFPCPLRNLILKFDQSLSVDVVADRLAAAAGRRWGVDRNGQVFTQALGTIVYDGSPEFTLDEDTATEADTLYFVDVRRDIFALRNHVICVGQDRDGNDVVCSWQWKDSMSDPTAAAFIGDEWCEVVFAPDGGNPYLTAQFRAAELARYQKLIKWQTDGAAGVDLFPGHYVEVDEVTHIDIPAGTVFQIIEKHGTLDARSGEIITDFLGAC